MKHQGKLLVGRNLRGWLTVSRKLVANLTNQCSIFINMLKPVNNIYKQKSHEIENVVGGLKFWEYFRACFAEARPLGYWRLHYPA
jgi:hypothetical protein